MFADLGHTVLIHDIGTPLSAVDAAKGADVVIVSVPIQATEAVIREVGPHVKKDGLLMDVTSIKQLPLEVMLASTEASSSSVAGSTLRMPSTAAKTNAGKHTSDTTNNVGGVPAFNQTITELV